MVHVALAFILSLTVTGKESSLNYEEAFAKAEKEKKPLLILVGARWCASCQVMKRDTIEPMKESGDLKDVIVVLIDKDERPELAEQLMRGETLPQVVVFSQNSGNWKRFSHTGMQDKSRVGELLQRASAK